VVAEPSEVLIVIPARGGSKRLPRKNILPLAGKPLICWTIEVAIASRLNAQILVTSDDDDILSIASQYDEVLTHKRPPELGTDSASTVDVVLESLVAEQKKGREYQVLILLQPTSPLRRVCDIRSSYNLFINSGSQDSVVSVCGVNHPSAWVGTVDLNGSFMGAQLESRRSQDYEKEFRLNGAVYVVNVNFLKEHHNLFTKNLVASIMHKDSSIDIDEAFDFFLCEKLLEFRSKDSLE